MSEPVVVQGTAVSNPHASGPPPSDAPTQHTKQTKCQDPFFAPLFYIDIVAIVAVAGATGSAAFESDNEQYSQQMEGYYICAVIAAIIGLLFSAGGLQVMMCIPQTLIKVALIFSVVVAGLVFVFNIITGNVLGMVFSLLFFLMSCCYAYCVWSRIPFATANLVTAITAVKANCGITIAAYIFTALMALWSFVWGVAFIGTGSSYCDTTNGADVENCNVSGGGWGFLFLLFVAYFFSHQVLQNTIHVTIAGVVATWWIAPSEASSFCSVSIFDSLKRALTTSFGSICFGSLLVAIIQALRAMANTARNQDDGILLCLAECILACIEGLIEYFNKWAFIYVGIYGMGYCESGKNVIQLFQNRGWEAIIADDLIGNVLMLVSLVVGCLTGCIGIIIELASDLIPDEDGESKAIVFVLGFVIGAVLCSILMSVIASAVNAVLVLFAEKPAELHSNHRELSENMLKVWREIYPGSV